MIPAATGTPQYSGNFIPEVWTGILQVKFYTVDIFPGIANTKWEGEISDQGDKVMIRTVPDIAISDHNKGQELDIQHPDSPMIEFSINRAKYFNFICDDIDKHQADIDLMNEWAQDAGEQMKIEIDKTGLQNIYADADSNNIGIAAGKDSGGYNMGATGTPRSVTKDSVVDFLMDASGVLDEQDIPETNRWFAVPSWMANLLKRSELKDVSMTGDTKSPIRNGKIGYIDDTAVHKSNQIKKVDDSGTNCYYPMAGHKEAVTFASQMTQMDNLKSERTFGQLVRGLNVFDFETVHEDALVTGYVYKG